MRKGIGNKRGRGRPSWKRWAALLLLALFCLLPFGAVRVGAEVSAGKCGADVAWSLDTNEGVLWISGSGDMYDFADGTKMPWYKYRVSIHSVEVGSGVTGIGSNAFTSCLNLTRVSLPGTLTRIGKYAFLKCIGLSRISLPDSLTRIESYAFQGSGLRSVTIPRGVKTIADHTFLDCFAMTLALLPDGIQSIEAYAFSGCSALKSVNVPRSVEFLGDFSFTGVPALLRLGCSQFTEKTIKAADIANYELLHAWQEPEFIWKYDYSSATGMRFCANDRSHDVVERVSTSSSVTRQPTCLEKGETTYVAEFTNACFGTQSRTVADIPALGHDLLHLPEIPATCEQAGRIDCYHCSRCDGYYSDAEGARELTEEATVKPATGHRYESTVTSQPTCTRPGIRLYVCGNDPSHRYTEEIPALGHQYEASVTREPTCTRPGIRTYVCRHDPSHRYTEEIPALGHRYESSVTKEPTCEESGIRTFVCQNDPSHRYTEEIPALGHLYEASVTKEPTCTEEGVKTFTCARDHAHNYTEPVPALGHELTHRDRVEPADGQEGSVEYWHCSRCGKYYANGACTRELSERDLILPWTGKNYVSSVEKEPTCTEPGVRRFVNVADETDTYTESIPPLGHALVHVDRAEPTREEEGHIAHWRCRACGRLFEDAAGTAEITAEMTVLPRVEKDHVSLIFGAIAAGLLLFFMLVVLLGGRKEEKGTLRR